MHQKCNLTVLIYIQISTFSLSQNIFFLHKLKQILVLIIYLISPKFCLLKLSNITQNVVKHFNFAFTFCFLQIRKWSNGQIKQYRKVLFSKLYFPPVFLICIFVPGTSSQKPRIVSVSAHHQTLTFC